MYNEINKCWPTIILLDLLFNIIWQPDPLDFSFYRRENINNLRVNIWKNTITCMFNMLHILCRCDGWGNFSCLCRLTHVLAYVNQLCDSILPLGYLLPWAGSWPTWPPHTRHRDRRGLRKLLELYAEAPPSLHQTHNSLLLSYHVGGCRAVPPPPPAPPTPSPPLPPPPLNLAQSTWC